MIQLVPVPSTPGHPRGTSPAHQGVREGSNCVIEFKCGVCGELMEADYSAAGRNAQCLKCGTVLQVPLPEMLPRLACPACQAELDFPVSKAGNVERCPKCGGIIRLPTVDGQGG